MTMIIVLTLQGPDAEEVADEIGGTLEDLSESGHRFTWDKQVMEIKQPATCRWPG